MSSYTVTAYTVRRDVKLDSPLRRHGQYCDYTTQFPKARDLFIDKVYAMVRAYGALDTKRGRQICRQAHALFMGNDEGKRVHVFSLALHNSRVEFRADHYS